MREGAQLRNEQRKKLIAHVSEKEILESLKGI